MSEYIVDFRSFAMLSRVIESENNKLKEPIVRCKDCEHRYDNQCGRYPDWFDIELDGFCAWGERRTDE